MYNMKISSGIYLVLLIIIGIAGCNGKSTGKKESQASDKNASVPDTGYTGIKQYMSGQLLVKEITFINGVRDGLMKQYYQTGQLRQTSWYVNGLRQDSAKWYYQDGRVFRSTPYKNDTIDGTQKQYYTNGRLKAKISFKKGLRVPDLQEFTMDGKLIGGYPGMVVNITDEYKTKGLYRISMELSDKSTKVNFYRGDFSEGVFDTVHCKQINTIKGIGHLELKKSGSAESNYVGIIGEMLTNFGNKYLIYKKIDLPYNDLK